MKTNQKLYVHLIFQNLKNMTDRQQADEEKHLNDGLDGLTCCSIMCCPGKLEKYSDFSEYSIRDVREWEGTELIQQLRAQKTLNDIGYLQFNLYRVGACHLCYLSYFNGHVLDSIREAKNEDLSNQKWVKYHLWYRKFGDIKLTKV